LKFLQTSVDVTTFHPVNMNEEFHKMT